MSPNKIDDVLSVQTISCIVDFGHFDHSISGTCREDVQVHWCMKDEGESGLVDPEEYNWRIRLAIWRHFPKQRRE